MKKLIVFVILSCLLYACGNNTHFITDANYRNTVQKQFKEREKLAENRKDALFGVFNSDLTTEQHEALLFLYAYMPLSDLADYDGNFFLQQVNYALATRDAFDWGKSIPEDIFRHFVLPYRVNNENLDTARVVFFNELKERLKGLSMYDAALEVNHWCHEKVTYKPTDIRTSSPLATIRTAWGRCGEESTFTVTALRAAGIPARQCYTPRWAHTDDNHAWVEVWIDGKWYYLGACEPEPELNMAWFSAPAKRAMMVHTNVFGFYKGNEETLETNNLYSKLNLLSHYAPVKNLMVKVVDGDNKVVENAEVDFKLYNYSEFYNLATKITNNQGIANLTTGYGDLLIWAKKGNCYGYEKASGTITDTVIIHLNRKAGVVYSEDMDINPPIPLKKDEVSSEKERENNRRLQHEDSIRRAYEASFPSKEASDDLARRLGVDANSRWEYIQKSYGNWHEISKFLEENSRNPHTFDLLKVIQDKDLRDTPADILTDHLINSSNPYNYPTDIYTQWVLNPRIRNEIIMPWRSLIKNNLPAQVRENASSIFEWVKNNITVNTVDNYYHCPLTPVGVYNLRVADEWSRDIFFVAMCRASNIAARVDAATGIPQVYENGEWKNIYFETQTDNSDLKATLVLTNSAENSISPKYYSNYTIARFVENDFVTLDYEDSPLVENFPVKLMLDEGYYRVITGNRADDGSALVRTQYFNLEAGKIFECEVELRPVVKSFDIKGKVSLQHTLEKFTDQSKFDLQTLAKGKGLALIFIDRNREPSQHVMNDIPLQQKALENWGGNIVFVVSDDKVADFNPDQFKGLPKQSLFMVDKNREVMNSLFADIHTDFIGDFPAVWLLTPDGEVAFMWQGYRIGIGEDLVKSLKINKLYQ